MSTSPLSDDMLRHDYHNEPVGILISGTKNDRSVRYSPGRSTSPIAVGARTWTSFMHQSNRYSPMKGGGHPGMGDPAAPPDSHEPNVIHETHWPRPETRKGSVRGGKRLDRGPLSAATGTPAYQAGAYSDFLG